MAERKQFTKQQAVDNWWICFYGARTRMWASTQAGRQVGVRASGQACRQAGERVNKRGRSKCNTRHGNRHENHRATWNIRKTQSTRRKPLLGQVTSKKIGTRWSRGWRSKLAAARVIWYHGINGMGVETRRKLEQDDEGRQVTHTGTWMRTRRQAYKWANALVSKQAGKWANWQASWRWHNKKQIHKFADRRRK